MAFLERSQIVRTADRAPPANGKELMAGVAANPAGDPRRLLPWLVEHCSKSGITIDAGCVITTGSYSGMYFADGAGTATGVIEGLPRVILTLE